MFEILHMLAYTTLGVLLVETIGPLWHQYAQHKGWFGDTIRYRHWLHHEIDYPTGALRPQTTYKSAGQWDWYIVALVVLAVIFATCPLSVAIPLTASVVGETEVTISRRKSRPLVHA